MTEIENNLEFIKLRQEVERIERTFIEERQKNGERIYKIELNMSNMRENIMEKLDEVKAAVSSKEGITFLVQSELDTRYANKRVEVWFDRIVWTVILGVVMAALSLVLIVKP